MQLIFSAGLILAIVLWGVVHPASLGQVFDTMLAVITRDFGWLYLWVVLGLVVLAALLAFSRYGDLKLGGEDDEPEFSIGSWFAMLFAAGMGIGLVFWGVAEPISHYGAPPPGILANTPEAANAAMRYSFFHWGLHPWAVYSIVAIAIAFFQFRKGGSALVGTVVQALSWGPLKRLGPVANVLAVIATAQFLVIMDTSIIGVALPDMQEALSFSSDGDAFHQARNSVAQALESRNRAHVLGVLARVGGNKSRAARLLGVDRRSLYRKLDRYAGEGDAEGVLVRAVLNDRRRRPGPRPGTACRGRAASRSPPPATRGGRGRWPTRRGRSG